MKTPIIGITVIPTEDSSCLRTGGSLKLNYNYSQVIHSAGGSPVLLTPHTNIEWIARTIHGLLIPGGKDINPRFFGQNKHPKTNLESESRSRFEMSLLGALPESIPVLGICYGCQLLNVWAGGTLHQHMPDQLGSDVHSSGSSHTYRVESDSVLASLMGTAPSGQSWHHQSIDRCATTFKPVAWAEDGTIEAIEPLDGRWLIGVQWHPERTMSDLCSRNLIVAFIEQARQRMESEVAQA